MILLNTAKGPVILRELDKIEDMIAAEGVQAAVWGPDSGIHPKEMLIASQFEGALLAGAFDSAGTMIGLVFSFPTAQAHIMHSQLLATLEDWRGCGIGARLKWFQRDWCLKRGITLVRWTVDPLRAANAELNIRTLGGTASVYFTDYYGPMNGIDAGAPSDRLLLEWHLANPRVASLTHGKPPDEGFSHACPAVIVSSGLPVLADAALDSPAILVPIPENFVHLSKADPSAALAWRMVTRGVFLSCFERGYAVAGFTRRPYPAYLLEKKPPEVIA
jgi:chorismate synthase